VFLIAGRERPDSVQVIGQSHKRVDGEWPFQLATANEAAEQRACRQVDEKPGAAVGDNREEKRTTRNVSASPIGHGMIVPSIQRPAQPALPGSTGRNEHPRPD